MRYRDLLTVFGRNRTLGRNGQMPNSFTQGGGVSPPTGFRVRRAVVGVSRAQEWGVTTPAMPTDGYAFGAWSIDGAIAGIEAIFVMTKDASPISRSDRAISGAGLSLVNGLISDAGKIVGQTLQANDWYNTSTWKERYRIEGKKTIQQELANGLTGEFPAWFSMRSAAA